MIRIITQTRDGEKVSQHIIYVCENQRIAKVDVINKVLYLLKTDTSTFLRLQDNLKEKHKKLSIKYFEKYNLQFYKNQ